ncbi:unnamed protein product [Colias eurytheme]|nr:unnamed protein product [Colias eurytheme]
MRLHLKQRLRWSREMPHTPYTSSSACSLTFRRSLAILLSARHPPATSDAARHYRGPPPRAAPAPAPRPLPPRHSLARWRETGCIR